MFVYIYIYYIVHVHVVHIYIYICMHIIHTLICKHTYVGVVMLGDLQVSHTSVACRSCHPGP